MSRSGRVSAVAAFFGFVVAGLVLGPGGREMTPTSFGVIPAGQGAAYQLLAELGLPVERSFVRPARLETPRTVWWIEPDRPCLEPAPPAGEADAGEAPASPAWSDAELAAWIAGGGTAVVFLPADPARCASSSTLAGVSLPARRAEGALAPAAPAETPKGGTRFADADRAAPEPIAVTGRLVRRPRTLEIPPPVVFEAGEAMGDGVAWSVVAELDGRPFALERALGSGRLVVISDPRFLHNRWLDRADAAPLALDLAVAYGVPWIDEHEHGFVPSPGTLAYLVTSPALPFLLGVLLLAALFAWEGAAVPPRQVAERDLAAPTLEAYVSSIAGFYSRTRDRARVLDRYRELTLRRLRRHFGLPPDAARETIVERLRGRRDVPPEALSLLAGAGPAGGAVELESAVAILDRLVARVAG